MAMRSPIRYPSRVSKIASSVLLTICFCLLPLTNALAWLYPEHRQITLLALASLEPYQRALLEKLWSEARTGHEMRLCASLEDTEKRSQPACMDFAAWPAVGGDHSCSARDMQSIVLEAPWILRVAAVGADLERNLARAQRRDERVNAVRRSDIDLLRFDADYVSRAQSNEAHFLLARTGSAMQPKEYAQLAMGRGAELNAIGAYAWYHQRAIAHAAALARADLPSSRRAEHALAMFADEGFALHFLEDGFAAGHVVGNWGNTAVRKGTHDYYNEHGVEVVTWKGDRFVAFGDAYLSPEDASRAALAVRQSLQQLTEVLKGKPQMTVALSNPEGISPAALDVCHETHFSDTVASEENMDALVAILMQTPMPNLGDVPGQLPRFHSEFGPFLGISTAARGAVTSGGFGSNQDGAGANAGLEAAVRVGVGFEGVLDESGDGLVSVSVGYRLDSPTRGASTVPGRGALTVRVRAPFWVVPGDIFAAAPVLAIASPQTLKRMAVRASNGGLIPWQSAIATPIGRFQFVLGREVALSFFDQNYQSPTVAPNSSVPRSSLEIDFPILEYRPFHTFSIRDSSSIVVQLYSGFDMPTGSSVVPPANGSVQPLHTIAVTGIRVAFDWRRYLP